MDSSLSALKRATVLLLKNIRDPQLSVIINLKWCVFGTFKNKKNHRTVTEPPTCCSHPGLYAKQHFDHTINYSRQAKNVLTYLMWHFKNKHTTTPKLTFWKGTKSVWCIKITSMFWRHYKFSLEIHRCWMMKRQCINSWDEFPVIPEFKNGTGHRWPGVFWTQRRLDT